MSPSEERAIRAVEVGIIATEGLWSVDGTPFTSYIEAELARHNLAQRAVAEASLLRRYIRVEPPCAWCGCAIKALAGNRRQSAQRSPMQYIGGAKRS